MRALVVVVTLASLSSLADSPYSYVPKRDPFSSGLRAPLPPKRCETSLCRFGLDELRLVAIVRGDLEAVAMFEDPRGIGLLARRNQEIGPNGARITSISRDCVTVTLRFESASGRSEVQPTELCVKGASTEVHELTTDKPMTVP